MEEKDLDNHHEERKKKSGRMWLEDGTNAHSGKIYLREWHWPDSEITESIHACANTKKLCF